MEFYSTSFFCEDPIYCHIEWMDQNYWPVTINIHNKINMCRSSPSVTFHLMNLQQLIAFKNSVIGACESAMEGQCQSLTQK